MAANLNDMTERSRAGWNSFAHFLGLSTLAVVVVLGLMALFLL